MRPTDDGGYIAVGHYDPEDLEPLLWILRLDAAGTIVWNRLDSHTGSGGNYGVDVMPLPDGGFAVVTSAGEFMDILRIAADGTDESIARITNQTNHDLAPWQMALASDGGILVVGGRFGVGDPTVSRVNPNGSLAWSRVLALPGNAAATALAPTPGDGVLVVSTQEFLDGAGYELLLTQFDDAGQVLWQRRYGDPGFQRAQDIVGTTGGGFVVVGVTEPSEGVAELTVFEIDASGNVSWQRAYGAAGFGSQHAMSIDTLPSGELLVAAVRSRGATGHDGWLLRLDAAGLTASCGIRDTQMTVSEDTAAWTDWGAATTASCEAFPGPSPSPDVALLVLGECECADADLDGFDSCFECNDDDPAVYPGASEVNDGLDNQCPGDPGYGQTDEVEGTLTAQQGEVCWNAQAGAVAYEVVRSPVPDFSSGCESAQVTATCWTDATPLGPDEVAYTSCARPRRSSGTGESTPTANHVKFLARPF